MKINGINKNNKEKRKLKVYKMVLGGAIVLSLSSTLTGCGGKTENQLEEQIQESKELKIDQVGFIKNGDESIPFYKKGTVFYNLETQELLGHVSMAYGFKCYVIVDDSDIIKFTGSQIIFFSECYPKTFLSSSIVPDFTNKFSLRCEEKYFENHKFSKSLINEFEFSNVETGEIKKVIGYWVSETQCFNFETFRIEEYNNYNLNYTISYANYDPEEWSYGEILDLIESLKEEYMTVSQ